MPKALTTEERLKRAHDSLCDARALDPQEPSGRARTNWVQKKRSRLLRARDYARVVLLPRSHANPMEAIEARNILAAVEREWPVPASQKVEPVSVLSPQTWLSRFGK
jgi:hypothetical protein